MAKSTIWDFYFNPLRRGPITYLAQLGAGCVVKRRGLRSGVRSGDGREFVAFGYYRDAAFGDREALRIAFTDQTRFVPQAEPPRAYR